MSPITCRNAGCGAFFVCALRRTFKAPQTATFVVLGGANDIAVGIDYVKEILYDNRYYEFFLPEYEGLSGYKEKYERTINRLRTDGLLMGG